MAATFLFTEIPKCSKPIYDDTDGLISSSSSSTACSTIKRCGSSSSSEDSASIFPKTTILKNKKVFKNITKWMSEVNNRNPRHSFPVSYL